MKRFLLWLLATFLILVVVPSPLLAVVLTLCFLLPINGWFGLLAILVLPAIALSAIILESWVMELDFWEDLD